MELAICRTEQLAYEHLLTPETILQRIFKGILGVEAKALVDGFVTRSIPAFRELSTIVGNIREPLNDDHGRWFSFELLLEFKHPPQKIVLNCQTQSPNYNIKPGLT